MFKTLTLSLDKLMHICNIVCKVSSCYEFSKVYSRFVAPVDGAARCVLGVVYPNFGVVLGNCMTLFDQNLVISKNVSHEAAMWQTCIGCKHKIRC